MKGEGGRERELEGEGGKKKKKDRTAVAGCGRWKEYIRDQAPSSEPISTATRYILQSFYCCKDPH